MAVIHELLQEAQQQMTGIAKDRKNSHQGYNFRGIDDVLSAVHPIFAELGIVCRPTGATLLHHETLTNAKGTVTTYVRYLVNYEFTAPDGSAVQAACIGEGGDTSDKASNKAMSAAYKYLMFQTLSIPVEGALDEGDQDHPERVTRAKIDRQGLLTLKNATGHLSGDEALAAASAAVGRQLASARDLYTDELGKVLGAVKQGVNDEDIPL